LWESLPAAVATTNFLDTVLEKSRPERAQVIVSDTDLGHPIDAHMRHVVYLHGHRSDQDSWVAGRLEYEALPGRRPIIHAKARQLLAEYPALVVGASLTDPDIHIGVAHGAAFSAAYLLEIARFEAIDKRLVQQAARIRSKLAKDPLAVVRRQLQFGRASGRRHGKRGTGRG
jgi:hypothetical protein